MPPQRSAPSALNRICLRVLTLIEDLATYTFNTHTAKDYFRKTCGILPFKPRTGPSYGQSMFGACPMSI
jgi:hypothetical protein